jgi:hypothetical protein
MQRQQGIKKKRNKEEKKTKREKKATKSFELLNKFSYTLLISKDWRKRKSKIRVKRKEKEVVRT